MLAKTEAKIGFSALSRFVMSSCLLLALAAGSPLSAAELPSQQVPLACQSNITIGESVDPVDNTLFHVILTVANVESSDAGDVPQTQQFPFVRFFPSCSAIPCTPAPGVDVVAGSESSNCPQALNAPIAGAGFVDFTFTPTLELGPNAAPGMGFDTFCDILVDVRVNPVPAVATTFNMEGTTTGACVSFDGSSSGSGSDDIMFVPAVPTLGEAALAVLALLLIVGSLVILRRRWQSSEAAP
ncbi:MAG: IPTL-CTERM sorting domain-containing protein [bacterium]|nr:IPTL-CTERM sorting domain-containing protein [bacterium]